MVKTTGTLENGVIRLREPVDLPPGTEVSITIEPVAEGMRSEHLLRQALHDRGLWVGRAQIGPGRDPGFKPVPVTGLPLSQVIIEDRT